MRSVFFESVADDRIVEKIYSTDLLSSKLYLLATTLGAASLVNVGPIGLWSMGDGLDDDDSEVDGLKDIGTWVARRRSSARS